MGTTPGRVAAGVDRFQQRHAVLGFPYAVVRKYIDDEGAREAALITYYGFLSLFPALLFAVAVVSRILVQQPELRRRLVTAIVPPSLQSDVDSAVAAMPTSYTALVVGLAGLILTGTGVVFSAYHTVNHVAAVPYRLRFGIVSRYLRVIVVLILVIGGAIAAGGLTVLGAAVPLQVAGSLLVVFTVLLLAARLLLARPAPVRALWPAAAAGAAAVTLTLTVGAAILPGLV
ncbi:MAG: YhjD/YihY/BrkB family envelope integrity protein, partial [Actinoplanes sp.]